MPSLAVLTGVVVYDRFVNGNQHVLSRPAWMMAMFFIVVSVGTTAVLYIAPLEAEQRVSERVYTQKEWERTSENLGNYIQVRSNPDDLIFNYGRESQLYFYADRAPAVPYFYDWVLEYDEDALAQIITGLGEAKPAYIVDSAQAPLFDDWEAAHPPILTEFLAENYQYMGRVYFADVYKLKEYTPPIPFGEPSATVPF
jgi:hypothetical protein